eukprot:scaffold25644_cov62-Phaeocystis_antarctica.AAC.12
MAKPSAVRTVQAQKPIRWLRTGSCLPVRWSSTRHASPGAATQSTSTAQRRPQGREPSGGRELDRPCGRAALRTAAVGCTAVSRLGLGLAAAAAAAAAATSFGSSLRSASLPTSHSIRNDDKARLRQGYFLEKQATWDVTSVAGCRSKGG